MSVTAFILLVASLVAGFSQDAFGDPSGEITCPDDIATCTQEAGTPCTQAQLGAPCAATAGCTCKDQTPRGVKICKCAG